MSVYEISDEQRKTAWSLVSRCNFARRGSFDGNKEKQYTGILAQIVVGDLFGYPRPEAGEDWDHGVDFLIMDKRIDLKTMGCKTYPKPYSINNLAASQVDAGETDVYLFSSLHKVDRVVTMTGWLKKSEIERKFLVPAGTTRKRRDGTSFELISNTYEIPNRVLHPWTTPDRFIMDMGMFGV